MPGPGCGTKKPLWLKRMVWLHMADKVTQTDRWDTDQVTQVGSPVASVELSFAEAIDAIIDAGQGKDGDIISVSSEPSALLTKECTGIYWTLLESQSSLPPTALSLVSLQYTHSLMAKSWRW